jgi:hypothetical protein
MDNSQRIRDLEDELNDQCERYEFGGDVSVGTSELLDLLQLIVKTMKRNDANGKEG